MSDVTKMTSTEFAERINRSKAMIAAMCSKRRPPAMSIPADPERDEDLFITDTLEEAARRLGELDRGAEELRKARLYLKGCMGHFYDETPVSEIAKDVAAEFHRGRIREQEQRDRLDEARQRAERAEADLGAAASRVQIERSRAAAWRETSAAWKQVVDAQADHIAQLTATKSPGSATDALGAADRVVYLIERGQPEGEVPTLWWNEVLERWFADANQATHYQTKAAADQAMDDRSGIGGVHRPFGRVTEHVFVDPANAPAARGHDGDQAASSSSSSVARGGDDVA